MTSSPELDAVHSQPTAVDAELIRMELLRVAESTHFRTSRRYPALLKYVVEATLAGKAEELKERTIGVEVFHRDLTYDTNTDPVVRVTAAEVRKRLLQYYEDPKHHGPWRITLHSGSYVPHFVSAEGAEAEARAAEKADAAPAVALATEAARGRRRWITAAVLLLLVIAAGAVWMMHGSGANSSVEKFWGPYLHRSESTLICVGSMPMLHPTPYPNAPTPEMGLLDAVQHYNIVPLNDAITLSRITSMMGGRGQSFRVMNAEVTSFEELQNGPVVLIGALNNQWTTRLTSKLRFRFEDSTETSRITDSQAKQQPDWVIHRAKQYSSLVQDYAVIARYEDPTTGRMVVIAGGIGPNGTLAAGDFLTTDKHLQTLYEMAPKGWKGVNVEAVIRTEVINGNSGPPSIVAADFW